MGNILSISQVAKLCAVVPSTVQFWERKGYLKSFKTFGGHRRFKKDDVLIFLGKRGRKLSHKVAEELLIANTRPERRKDIRISMNHMVDVELINGHPDSKLTIKGRLSDVSNQGFGIVLSGLDLNRSALKNIFDNYRQAKAWIKDEVGFLRNPLCGRIIAFRLAEDYIRLGLVFTGLEEKEEVSEDKVRAEID